MYNSAVLGTRRKIGSWVRKGPFHRVVGLPVVFGLPGDFLFRDSDFLTNSLRIARRIHRLRPLPLYEYGAVYSDTIEYGHQKGQLSCD